MTDESHDAPSTEMVGTALALALDRMDDYERFAKETRALLINHGDAFKHVERWGQEIMKGIAADRNAMLEVMSQLNDNIHVLKKRIKKLERKLKSDW